MDTSVAAVTVSVVLPVMLLEAAWIVVVPVPTAVAKPAALIVATVTAEELHVAVLSNAIHLAASGKNAGCWVMRLNDAADAADASGEDDDAKIIVRSNGTVTYVGKDIAYQLWKFGLLGRDF